MIEKSDFLRILRVKHMNRLIIGNLNINPISSKFDQLKLFVQCKVDILVVTETKSKSTFLTSQFVIDGYSEPQRFDRNRNGGGVLINIREDIPSKLLADHKLPHEIEQIFCRVKSEKKEVLTFWFIPSAQPIR